MLAYSVKGKVMAEMHTFANVGHGFGMGMAGTNSTYWVNMADNFIKQVTSDGKLEKTKVNVEVPKEYTKTQTYTVKFPFGDSEVTYAANDDGSTFYIYFSAFGGTQIIEGVVGKDGIATVTYDKSGFMKGDTQMIISSANQKAWNPIKR